MELIADSGSTNTDWALLDKGRLVKDIIRTKGLNANYLTEKEACSIIEHELLPHISNITPNTIYFYGSGCSTPEKQKMMRGVLRTISPNADVVADHDMLGAAISLCGKDMGMVCILGTGSNTCFYDGKMVKKNILSLGYLLGDEGSGTYIGKKILYHYLKGLFPIDLCRKFEDKYQLTPTQTISQMYSVEKVGTYFSSFSFFASENIEHPAINRLVKDCFADFFKEQVFHFEEALHYPIGFVGSIASIFRPQLTDVAQSVGLKVGKILKNPIDGLIANFQNHE